MTTVSQMSGVTRGMILLCLYGLFLLQFGCMLTGVWKKEKPILRFCLSILVITGIILLSFRYVNQKLFFNRLSDGKIIVMKISQFPFCGIIIILLSLTMLTGRMIWHVVHYERNTLTKSAIKESADYLPMGLCFFTEEGFILLSNWKMEQICQELTGKDLQNGNVFWSRLSRDQITNHAEPVWHERTHCLRMKNGEIWSFERQLLKMDKKNVWQLAAVNISELYQLSQQLKRENSQLTEMNQRLRQHGENMDAYVRSREILETKIQIHKEMGQALLASRAYLAQTESVIEKESVRKRWEYVVLLLKKEAEISEGKNEWKQFVKTAEDAGVKIIVYGDIPTAEKTLELLMTAAAEALTNAVRHGGADQLQIEIQHDTRWHIFFTNNGKKPESIVTEGGGLGSLRIRLEEVGGSMNIFIKPEFVLAVTLPEKGTKYDTNTGTDCRR